MRLLIIVGLALLLVACDAKIKTICGIGTITGQYDCLIVPDEPAAK